MRDRHGLVGQRPNDVVEHLALDENLTWFVDVSFDGNVGTDFVVEGRKLQFAFFGNDPHALKDGHCGALRECAGCPRNGIAQHVSIKMKFHASAPLRKSFPRPRAYFPTLAKFLASRPGQNYTLVILIPKDSTSSRLERALSRDFSPLPASQV